MKGENVDQLVDKKLVIRNLQIPYISRHAHCAQDVLQVSGVAAKMTCLYQPNFGILSSDGLTFFSLYCFHLMAIYLLKGFND